MNLDKLEKKVKEYENMIKELNHKYEIISNEHNNCQTQLNKKLKENEEMKVLISKLETNLEKYSSTSMDLKINEINNLKKELSEQVELSNMLKTKISNIDLLPKPQLTESDVINELQDKLRLNEEELKIKDFTIKRLVNELNLINNKGNISNYASRYIEIQDQENSQQINN
jgi:hypothetical protein